MKFSYLQKIKEYQYRFYNRNKNDEKEVRK